MPKTPFEEGMAVLRAHYAERIEAAVAAGRMDLVRELADHYDDEALELMLTLEGGTPTQPGHGTFEILEFGPWSSPEPAARPGDSDSGGERSVKRPPLSSPGDPPGQQTHLLVN